MAGVTKTPCRHLAACAQVECRHSPNLPHQPQSNFSNDGSGSVPLTCRSNGTEQDLGCFLLFFFLFSLVINIADV